MWVVQLCNGRFKLYSFSHRSIANRVAVVVGPDVVSRPIHPLHPRTSILGFTNPLLYQFNVLFLMHRTINSTSVSLQSV